MQLYAIKTSSEYSLDISSPVEVHTLNKDYTNTHTDYGLQTLE